MASFGLHVKDAIVDGPVMDIERDRGIVHFIIAPDGDFEADEDLRGISVNIEDLADAMRQLGVIE